MNWQLLYVLPACLLATTTFALPSVPSRFSDGPLQSTFRVPPGSSVCGSDREWNLSPNLNSTHHLIFNSVSGLLQRWPNTLRRNGASLRSTPISPISHFLRKVTVLFPPQSPKGQFCTTGVRTPESQVHPIGLRSTLNIPTGSALNPAM